MSDNNNSGNTSNTRNLQYQIDCLSAEYAERRDGCAPGEDVDVDVKPYIQRAWALGGRDAAERLAYDLILYELCLRDLPPDED